MGDKGQVVRVNCKRCGRVMPKWEWLIKRKDSKPFPFDSICGYCITDEEVRQYYPAATSHRK